MQFVLAQFKWESKFHMAIMVSDFKPLLPYL